VLKNLNFKKGVLWLVARNELQVKSVRLSASLKFENWALHTQLQHMGAGREESKSASLTSTLPRTISAVAGIRPFGKKILKLQHSILKL
jgi:hypothetical protein